ETRATSTVRRCGSWNEATRHAAEMEDLVVEPLKERYDAVIVGARCAGAATAMLLARRGMTVLLCDRDRRGADTLSTLAMMRAGVLQLHRWELIEPLRLAATPAIRSTSFVYGDEVITVPIKARDGVD